MYFLLQLRDISLSTYLLGVYCVKKGFKDFSQR